MSGLCCWKANPKDAGLQAAAIEAFNAIIKLDEEHIDLLSKLQALPVVLEGLAQQRSSASVQLAGWEAVLQLMSVEGERSGEKTRYTVQSQANETLLLHARDAHVRSLLNLRSRMILSLLEIFNCCYSIIHSLDQPP